ncbi:MAG: cytochrome c [bacterium]|nr:cytochrome c [bacterium]
MKNIFTYSLIVIFLFIVIFLGLVFFNEKNRNDDNFSNLVSMENASEQILLGSSLYLENCASCHGNKLQGQPKWNIEKDSDGHNYAPPLNGTGHTWHHNQEYLFNIIRYGFKKMDPNYKGKMMGNEDLTDDEIWSILAYVKSIWPDSIKDKYESTNKN